MISLAILIRAYLVIGLIFAGATYASARDDKRQAGQPVSTGSTDLIAVFAMAVFWLPVMAIFAAHMIWKDIRHG